MRHTLGLIALLMTLPASAGLTVLFDNGNTQALAAPTTVTPQPAAPLPSNNILPIRTPQLRVGRVIKRATPAVAYALRPTCVIGADPDSLSWLRQHRHQLKAVNAYCWLVQAETNDDLNRVNDIADGIVVLPAPGLILRRAFGIKHYPALISSRWIEQ